MKSKSCFTCLAESPAGVLLTDVSITSAESATSNPKEVTNEQTN